ncbi:MAG: CHAT domain-containing protein [Symploca sp. SIO2B6]|nr:CHAT domain-containing protein [Symploca sp. SIO2B6]
MNRAIAIAERIEDYRAQSFALGKLGYIYECRQDYDHALKLTKQAEWAADQALTAPDSLYLWQWQRGRILKRQGNVTEAIATYENAIATLEKIRNDILLADRDIQFDFRDTVEPIYRQLAILRLNQAPSSQIVMPEEQESGDIGAALTAIDSLKLAELQNYFGDDCLIVTSVESGDNPQALTPHSANTGVFSTFITDERTAIILTLPSGEQRVEWLGVEQDRLNDTINQFRIQLETSLYSLRGYDPEAGQPLYDQLIRPFLPDLDQANIKTLVFVQDGPFRSVPMAALYDGEHYLIEHYAIATTPSLSLTPVDPLPKRDNLRALALGVSQRTTVDGRNWAALNGVRRELDQIAKHLPGSRRLLNANFTRDRLRQELQTNAYSILHVATHGEFGAEPEDTFLVTGDAQKLTIGELDSAIRQAGGTREIDLLILTACKTAIGDNRSALGLAGVAVQAGARSAIASLWSINDNSTAQIMDELYQQLSDSTLTTAEVLQSAQLTLLHNGGKLARPGFWAPFILIGDWR